MLSFVEVHVILTVCKLGALVMESTLGGSANTKISNNSRLSKAPVVMSLRYFTVESIAEIVVTTDGFGWAYLVETNSKKKSLK